MSHSLRHLLLAVMGLLGVLSSGVAQEDASVRFSTPDSSTALGPDRFRDAGNDPAHPFDRFDAGSTGKPSLGVQLEGDIQGAPGLPRKDGFLDRRGGWADRVRPRPDARRTESGEIIDARPLGYDSFPPAARIARETLRSGQAAQDSVEPDLFRTQDTSLKEFIQDPPKRSDILANNSNPGRAVGAPITTGGATNEGDVDDESSQNGGANTGDDLVEAAKPPRWTTMLLIASLAANLYFCYIARDAHAKYRNLVADISESDTRRERQSRRLRPDDDSKRVRPDDVDFMQAAEV